MSYPESVQIAAEHAKNALTKMLELKVPPSPNNFRIWYHHFSEQYPDLSIALTGMIDRKESFMPQTNDTLFCQFFSFEEENKAINESTGKLSDEFKKAMELVARADKGARIYGETLETANQGLSQDLSTADLELIVQNLNNATEQMVRENQDLQEKLQETSGEIESLKNDLDDLRTDSLTDSLTSIANRKHFDAELGQRMDEAAVQGTSLCLVMADVDHFKKFNNTYGHLVGDQVLKLVAATLRDNVKGQDLPARYGGEEFALILPTTDVKDAKALGDQIRTKIATKELVNRKSGQRMGTITISMGVSRFRAGDTASTLIGRADAALYQAKHAGRNQVLIES